MFSKKYRFVFLFVTFLIFGFTIIVYAGDDSDSDSDKNNKSFTVALSSASSAVSTNIDTNNDGNPANLFTGTAAGKRLGSFQFSNLNEITIPNDPCTTSSGESGIMSELVQGNLVLNIPSRNNKNVNQIVIELTSLEICFSTESNGFSAFQEGEIIDGSGKFKNVSGSISGEFEGETRIIDSNPEFHSFSTVRGKSILTIDY